MLARQMTRATLLSLILFFLVATEGSGRDVPRLRATKGVWSPQQVTQWATGVRNWASQTREVVVAWARAERLDPGMYTEDLDSLIHHTAALKADPYNPYETYVTRATLAEVKGVLAIMASAQNSQFAARMNDAMKKARGFQDAMFDHGNALTKWYAANSPRPIW
jgi:hypothetical protein